MSNGLTRSNDVVESSTFRSENDADLTDELAAARNVSENRVAAEAEAEADVEAEVDLDTAAISLNAESNGIGSAVAASGVTVGGILSNETGIVSTGVTEISERAEATEVSARAREEVPGDGEGTIALPTGNLESEVEAEAEAEAEVEVGFNAAGAGAGAVASAAGNNYIPVSSDAATATSTSVSVKENGEQVFDDSDEPGPEPLGDLGLLPYQAVDLSEVIFEVEVEAEAEAQVGYNAGAVAAGAGAAGFEGVQAEIDMDATVNAAASAAASGAYTSVTISVPEEGMAGFVKASARAWDPEGRGVAAAVAVAGTPLVGGAYNGSELEAEGLFEVFVEVSIYTEAYDPDDISFLVNIAPTVGSVSDIDDEPEGIDSVIESEAEVEVEAEAEAGYGVAGASTAVAASGFAATVVADTMTSTGAVADATSLFGTNILGIGDSELLDGTALVDRIQGDGGNDTINGAEGGAGADVINGGAGGDLLAGDQGNDSLSGGLNDDRLIGGLGDDWLNGGVGDDVLSGGDGMDTANASGAQSNYTLQITADDFVLVDRQDGRDGTDRLDAIELIDFAGGNTTGDGFDLGSYQGFANLGRDDFDKLVEMYIAYFDRAPDAVGLYFWGAVLANGELTLEQIADQFFAQPETVADLDLNDNTAFVQQIYQNVLGRDVDDEGEAFWVGLLDNGEVSKSQFILEVLEGVNAPAQPTDSAATVSQRGVDRAYLDDKTDLGTYFSASLGLNDTADAESSLALFDGTEASITAARDAMDEDFAEAIAADGGEFLLQLVGVYEELPFV